MCIYINLHKLQRSPDVLKNIYSTIPDLIEFHLEIIKCKFYNTNIHEYSHTYMYTFLPYHVPSYAPSVLNCSSRPSTFPTHALRQVIN